MKHTLLLVLATTLATQAHALRCSHRVVTVGDYDFEVAERCGEPAYVNTHITYPYRLVTRQIHHRVVDTFPYAIVVDEWVYNFGGHRLLYRLEFENGRLVRIGTRGKGYWRN